MTPDQKQQLQEYFSELGKAWIGTGTTFAYDDQGRVTETRRRNDVYDETTSTRYNERGDKIRQRTTFKRNSLLQVGDPSSSPESSERSHLPEDSDTRYDYQYDSYGNWTEETMTDADGSSAFSRTRRVLTYY